MWRTVWSSGLLKQSSIPVVAPLSSWWRIRRTMCPITSSTCYDDTKKNGDCRRALLNYCCNIESWKMKLSMEGKKVIDYSELLEACKKMGFARSLDEAIDFARVLDEARVVLLFRDKVFLHPYKVVDLIRRSVSPAVTLAMKEELRILQEKKLKIDIQAHKQVQRFLWSRLSLVSFKFGLFFRLTYWEFSWDVTSPIAYFCTAAGIVSAYSYFLFTGRYPTYSDLLERLFRSRQRKLFQMHNFDVNRYKELQKQLKNRLQLELD
ncbi:hypothetical protein LWI28_019011 [Acer negundo]|uniref:Calcium uniporter protein C-terminal domain-containing protein n=1 Tax=Acer negundo TaxID=4023 RepID=A0AAD5JTP2_ACENE|nr:hypothetical protein LWI28_019011 [Acer negundo]KAK4858962.1 hypothetical protein QYF36_024467 [Acer negundo]